MPSPKTEKFLTANQLCERWGGCSHMFIQRRLESDPTFPKPVKFGGRKRFFSLAQVEMYERKFVTSGGKADGTEVA
jgi:predicted DNA-binding transcriptional regulator AlpA